MLADRKSPRRPRKLAPVRAALALTLGLASVAALGTGPSAAVTPGQVQVALVMPLVLPTGSAGIVGSDALAQFTAPQGILTRELDAVINRPVAIAIDPRIIASIRLLGSSAPKSASDWLTRLAAATNDTFALSYADQDLTLATQAGSQAVLAPISLDFAVDRSRFAAASTSTPSTASPILTTLPSTAGLLAWPYTLTNIAWPRENTVVAADLTALTASKYSTVIVSSNNVSSPTATVVQVASTQLVVADSATSTALRDAIAAATAGQQQAAMPGLFAAASAAAASSGTVVATLDRSPLSSGAELAATLDQIAATPAFSLVRLSTALASPPGRAALVERPQSPDALAAVTASLATENSDSAYSTVANDPTPIRSARRIDLLALLSNQWSAIPAGWRGAVSGYAAASRTLQASVSVVNTSSVNLLADHAALPVTVANDLDQPVTVVITVRPDTGLLYVADSHVRLDIAPRSQGKGQIPVEAISNGTVRVTVSLATSAGVPIGTSSRTAINVQAGWETPVVLVLAALVVAMLAFGLVRSVRRRRRR